MYTAKISSVAKILEDCIGRLLIFGSIFLRDAR